MVTAPLPWPGADSTVDKKKFLKKCALTEKEGLLRKCRMKKEEKEEKTRLTRHGDLHRERINRLKDFGKQPAEKLILLGHNL